MPDYTGSFQNSIGSGTVQQNPYADISKMQMGAAANMHTGGFQCMPSDYGCIPVPAQTQTTTGSNPQLGIWPQQQMQTITPASYDVQYLNQFLATQIGRQVRVEFLIGTNTFIDRAGTLLAVGTNYILLQEQNSNEIIACDFYNIKFVKIFY